VKPLRSERPYRPFDGLNQGLNGGVFIALFRWAASVDNNVNVTVLLPALGIV
jgi:hypothetical protein